MTHDHPLLATGMTRRHLLRSALGGAAGLVAWYQGWPQRRSASAQQKAPSGQMTWAIHTTIVPSWFDPAETQALVTPYMVLYAIHDALLKPMPDDPMFPSLATAWRESEDGLTYDFELRQGVKFHNGDPLTAEDVRFSFERYKGAVSADLKKRVQSVEIVNAHHVRFRLHEPWSDFMTFYGTNATGAGWIVPRRYVETIGDEAFKNQPVGLGPYRLIAHQPGVELVLEAYPDYWRQVPHVKRLVFKSVPDATTRLAMVKTGEADVAYGLLGPLAEEVRLDPKLKLESALGGATHWMAFLDQYNLQSPWADIRVRLAANYAINRPAINDAEMLGYALLTGGIIPRRFEFALPLEPYGYNPGQARRLLTAAGYLDGFDAGECSTDLAYASVVEAVANDLAAVGIRTKVRPMERAAIQAAQREKTLKGLTRHASAASGSAATRIEAFFYSRGSQSFLQDPEIDEWYRQQSSERDPEKRAALLKKIQQKAYDEARFMPIWEPTLLCAVGPRVAVSGLNAKSIAYSAPYEDVQLST